MAITFNFLQSGTLRNRKTLKSFLASIFKAEGIKLDAVDIIFCSDDYLLAINKQFLNHDYYTDIITFSIGNQGQPVQGEIYISLDTIRSNASRFNNSIEKELHRVIFHGILHLCGYLDKTKKEQGLMTSKEDFYLSLYFDVPRGA